MFTFLIVFFFFLISVLPIPEEALKLGEDKDFEVKAYKITAAQEQTRAPRLVRVAVVQNHIVRPTTDPVAEQVRRWGLP